MTRNHSPICRHNHQNPCHNLAHICRRCIPHRRDRWNKPHRSDRSGQRWCPSPIHNRYSGCCRSRPSQNYTSSCNCRPCKMACHWRYCKHLRMTRSSGCRVQCWLHNRWHCCCRNRRNPHCTWPKRKCPLDTPVLLHRHCCMSHSCSTARASRPRSHRAPCRCSPCSHRNNRRPRRPLHGTAPLRLRGRS